MTEEITSFNALFVAADRLSFKLEAFTQDRHRMFTAVWRVDGSPENALLTAVWHGSAVTHRRPFDAARDAFLLALKESPYHQPPPEPETDLFG